MSKRLEIKSSSFFETAIYGVFLFITGLVLPALLIFIIKFTGYSEIVEEVAKALVVLFLILKLSDHKRQILAGIIFGFLFGLSENFFYFGQIFQFGDVSIFWQRFLWTVPMHIITVLVMVFAAISRRWALILGLAGAIILHTLFNGIVVDMLMK